MAKSWATLPGAGPSGTGVDLHIDLRETAARSGSGVRRALTDALREAVRGGRLVPGTRLPSSRTLAVDLGVARNTVADAYADLVAEGWLTARQGSGTRVAERAVSRPAAPPPPPRTPGPARHDLLPGSPDLSAFPRAAWLRAARKAVAAAPNEAFGYGDPRGRVELRTALADYLARARGVYADPDRIVVCAGAAHGLQLLAGVLREGRGGSPSVAVESYGLDVHRELLTAAGLRTPPLPYDEQGTRTDALPRLRPDAVLLTPAHQFPLGVALPPERRAETVDWARRGGGLIVEDDYDGEFRYDRQSVGALQGLDPERVVYLGTASKSLAPGLRLGWLVLPARLAADVARGKGPSDWACGALDQLTLAEFLTSGAYDRHVRACRLRYRRRRDQLVAALAERVPQVSVSGIAAGLHAVLELPAGAEQSAIRAAAWQGLTLLGLDRFRHPDVPRTDRAALVVGYGTPPDHGWAGALDALCEALAAVLAETP
ncbi:PLP-dependent aminotransferase family protein [Streptomyces sp. Da 82-17]|uniref:MocR-like pyridoxine biosynthesis transcription factor PdxR n=1 Tax=Streptomyces sp. Da 82-17 TaxID=3377116 RepID=UPI0038D4D781